MVASQSSEPQEGCISAPSVPDSVVVACFSCCSSLFSSLEVAPVDCSLLGAAGMLENDNACSSRAHVMGFECRSTLQLLIFHCARHPISSFPCLCVVERYIDLAVNLILLNVKVMLLV